MRARRITSKFSEWPPSAEIIVRLTTPLLKWPKRFGGRDNWGGLTKRMGTEGEARPYSGRAAVKEEESRETIRAGLGLGWG
jgi:hypothetical protein